LESKETKERLEDGPVEASGNENPKAAKDQINKTRLKAKSIKSTQT